MNRPITSIRDFEIKENGITGSSVLRSKKVQDMKGKGRSQKTTSEDKAKLHPNVFRLSNASTLFLIRQASFMIYSKLEAILKAHELTVGQYMVLNTLHRRGSRSSAALSRTLSVTPQTLIRQIIALEERRLIFRVKDEEDQRALIVELTDRGKSVLARSNSLVNDFETSLFERLDKKSLETFRQQLILISTR